MLPDVTGRYCNSCNKSVIDFTEKTDEEVQQFILNNFNQPLCGRFKNTQIQRIVIELPQNILNIQMPSWMRFLVACLLIFGISIFPFEITIAGKVPITNTFYQGEPIKADSTKKTSILKKKKKRLKYSSTINYRSLKLTLVNTETMILGGFGLQDNPIIKSIFDLPENPFHEFAFNILPKETNQQDKSLPKKEEPRPTPFMPTEFILPSILLIRKETDSQSME